MVPVVGFTGLTTLLEMADPAARRVERFQGVGYPIIPYRSSDRLPRRVDRRPGALGSEAAALARENKHTSNSRHWR